MAPNTYFFHKLSAILSLTSQYKKTGLSPVYNKIKEETRERNIFK